MSKLTLWVALIDAQILATLPAQVNVLGALHGVSLPQTASVPPPMAIVAQGRPTNPQSAAIDVVPAQNCATDPLHAPAFLPLLQSSVPPLAHCCTAAQFLAAAMQLCQLSKRSATRSSDSNIPIKLANLATSGAVGGCLKVSTLTGRQ